MVCFINSTSLYEKGTKFSWYISWCHWAENDLDKDKLIKMINKSIEKLPKKCKEIFLLSKRDGFTNQEISEILSISIKTVESQITIAFKQLRKQIL